MREFKKRRTLGAELLRVVAGCAGILVLAAAAYVAGNAAWGMYGKFASAAAARSGAEAELSQLQERHGKIEADVEALQSERGVEGAVRERYGLSRPGEGQIDIVRHSSTTEAIAEEKGVFGRLWEMLFVW